MNVVNKKIHWFIIGVLLLFPVFVWAAGSQSVSRTPKAARNNSGHVVTISFTADASDASFPVSLIESDSTDGAAIQGKWLTNARTEIGTIAPTTDFDIYIFEGVADTDDFMVSTAGLAIGSTTTAVASNAFGYVINETAYTKAAVAAGTAPGDDVVPQSTYGAVAFDINASGTITAVEATDNATGYATAALAVAGIPSADSAKCRMGWITVTKSDGAFTLGTTALNAANTTVVYTSRIPEFDIMGGNLTNRDSTANEDVYPANTAGDNRYWFVTDSLMVVAINSLVNSSTFALILTFN